MDKPGLRNQQTNDTDPVIKNKSLTGKSVVMVMRHAHSSPHLRHPGGLLNDVHDVNGTTVQHFLLLRILHSLRGGGSSKLVCCILGLNVAPA